MKVLHVLASALLLCSLVKSRAIEPDSSDGHPNLVARVRGGDNRGNGNKKPPPAEDLDPEVYDPLSGKPWGQGADSKEYIERLRTERLPDRIDGGFRPRLSRTPPEGATGFYRRPNEHVRAYLGDAAPYHRSVLDATYDFYPDAKGKVYKVAPNPVRELNRRRSLEFAEKYPGTAGDEKLWASLDTEREYDPKNLRKKYKDIPPDHPDRDHTYDRRRLDSVVGRVPKHESDNVEFHLANQAGREAQKHDVGIELISNPSERTKDIQAKLIYAPSGHPKWGEPVVSTGQWTPSNPNLLPEPMPRYISRSPPQDRPLNRPDDRRSRSPRDNDLVDVRPRKPRRGKENPRQRLYDDDNYHNKRDVIGKINDQETGPSNSQANEESLYREYVAAMEVIQGNASAILFPFLDDMINGSNSSLVYEAAWAVQSNMLATDEFVMGPFWGMANSFEEWEDQWLLTHGFYVATDGSIVVPSNYSANQTRVTNDTIRELKDMLAVNDTSIIPSNELMPNKLTTGADDDYFEYGAIMRQNWTDWSNITDVNGTYPSIDGIPMNLTSVSGAANETTTLSNLNLTASNDKMIRRTVQHTAKASHHPNRTLKLNRRDAELHLDGLHRELHKRHSAGEKDLGIFFEWVKL